MKKLMLVFAVALAFCPVAMASDIAFYIGPFNPSWYGNQQFAHVDTIIAETGGLFKDVQKFDDKQFVEFGAWIDKNANDGEMDIIWLNGTMPSVLYQFPNVNPDGSRAELWLDGGNMIINVGDWFGYTSYEGGVRSADNTGTGAANILDLAAGVIVSADGTQLKVTPTGHQYLPSLPNTIESDRPIVLSQVVAPWEVAAIFAQNGAGTRADPVVIHNTATDGYLAVINQEGGFGWLADRGLTTAEFINNWVKNAIGLGGFAARPDPKDGAVVTGTWASLGWKAGEFAVSHDMYLGESFEDVNAGTGNTFRGNVASPLFLVGLGVPGDPYPGGLVPGTTYYWRVDEVNQADPSSPRKGAVWSFSILPTKVYQPIPADGAKYQDPGVTLKWTPGLDAKLHYVYFGDNPETVSNATAGAPTGTASYAPAGPLEKGKTYYWRVDEFDGAATHKGDVWSFTTLPDITVSDPNLVAWYKFEPGESTKVIDFSGHNNHGTIIGTVQWAESLFNLALEFLGDDLGHVDMPPGIVTTAKGSILMWINTTQGDAANNDEGMLWWACQTSAGDGYGGENEIHINIDDPGNGQLDFFLEEDGGGSDITINGPDVGGTGWRHVAATWDLTDGCRLYVDGVQVGFAAHNTNVKNLAAMRLGRPVGTGSGNCYYDGLMDDVRLFNYAISAAQISQIIAKGENLLQAGTANPSDGALVAVNLATPLSWSAGEKASQHDVYFGLDKAAVADANASDTTGIYRGRQSATSYTPPEGVQIASGPYYWRIDEVSSDGTITQGRVWSFSVADYALVEDFESYNDIDPPDPGSNRIFDGWVDGFLTPATNGAVVGNQLPPYAERTIVHSGRQSAPMVYNNTAAVLSEVTRTFAAQNWTSYGIQTLSLWFCGDPANVPGKLYAKINGVKVAYDGEAVNLTRQQWQPWNVDLASVGTNLQSVTSLAVGIEGAGAKGTLLLDDIRRYPYARQSITPVQPDPNGLVGYWRLDEGAGTIATDSSGSGNSGTLDGGPTVVAGQSGQALAFANSRVAIPASGSLTADLFRGSFTLTAWINPSRTGNTWQQVFRSIRADGTTGDTLFLNNDGRLSWRGRAGGAWTTLCETAPGVVPANQWTHVVVTGDGTNFCIYVTGTLTQKSAFQTTDGTNANYYLGGNPGATTESYTGMIDDVRVYSRTLSDAEAAGLAGRTLPFDRAF
jgi:hypothetical protein